jgi:Fe-S-cluster containining protein
LEVEIDKYDYQILKEIGKEDNANKLSYLFIVKNPDYKDKEKFLDQMYGDRFAILKKNNKGYCNMLDLESRLCTIYENRPSVCRDFSNKSIACQKIKECIK